VKHVIFGQADKLAGYRQLAHLGVPDDQWPTWATT